MTNTVKSLEDLYGSSDGLSSADGLAANATGQTHVDDIADAGQDQHEQDKGENVVPDAKPDKATDTSVPPTLEDDLPKDVAGIRAAVQDERRKRREYEAKVAEYEKSVAEHKRQIEEERRLRQEWETNARALYARDQQWQKLQQKQQRPDPLLDPEAALQHQQQQYQNELAHELASRDRAIYETRVEMSQALMRSQHQDYDDIEAIFADEMARDPQLEAQLLAQSMPAKFAYDVGKRIKLNREMGNDPDAYIQRKIAEALAANAQQQTAPTVPMVPTVPTASRPASPQSLARVPSVAPRSQPSFTGPPPLEQLYK